ncbi:aminopeptidase P family N-terminal domain-containing protein, partial [bacterium]|nr:aminopeptidase P family N-terminal domain-containing protein [bacterium]
MPAPTNLLSERIQRTQEAMKQYKGAPMLVTDPSNVGWLTGIPHDFQKDAHVLVTPEVTWFVTDGRYENRIPEIPGVKPFIWGSKHPHRYPELKELIKGDTLVVDTRGLALDIFQAFPKMLGINNFEVPPGFIDRLRMIKGETEITLIREALEIAMAQFRYMVEEWLPANKNSATDMDFRDALEEWPNDKGGEGVSFDSLVAMDHDADTPHPDMTRAPRPLK